MLYVEQTKQKVTNFIKKAACTGQMLLLINMMSFYLQCAKYQTPFLEKI